MDLARVNSALQTGIRSPLDTAILKKFPDDLTGYEKLDEIPFDFERRRLSIVVERECVRRWLLSNATALK